METRTDESRRPLYMFLGLRGAILVASQSIQIAMSLPRKETSQATAQLDRP